MYLLVKQTEEYNDEYSIIQDGYKIVAASEDLGRLEKRKLKEELLWLKGGVDDPYHFGDNAIYNFNEENECAHGYDWEFRTDDPELAKKFLKEVGTIFEIINLKDKKYNV